MKTGRYFGILLAKTEEYKNKVIVIGKTLEIDGVFVSGKFLIPIGRYVFYMYF